MKRILSSILVAAALAAAAGAAQAVCTLVYFQTAVDANRNASLAPVPSSCVNGLNLSAASAKSDTVPAGAQTVVIGASCAVYYAAGGASAAVLAADVTDGTATPINPTQLLIAGYSQVSVISPTACKVTLSYYK